jgi:hypothetical protein
VTELFDAVLKVMNAVALIGHDQQPAAYLVYLYLYG